MLVMVQVLVSGLYLPPVFKSASCQPPQTIISLPLHTALCSFRPIGALTVLVAVQLFVPGLYFPPVFMNSEFPAPPQTIISLPVHTAVAANRAAGGLIVLVAAQVSVGGLYIPPVFKPLKKTSSIPPQTIISLPVQVAV